MRIKTLIWKLNSQIEERYGALTEQFGVSSAGLEVLELLHERDGQTPSELSKQLMRASTSFTPILDGLQNGGFVCREAHPSDRRKTLIFLTEKGKALKDDLEAAMQAQETALRLALTERGDKSFNSNLLEILLAPLPPNA